MAQITERRAKTEQRITELAGELSEASSLLGEKACVYATGSFGRLEASEYSDLDLFIVGRNRETKRGIQSVSELSRLDEILVKADLIHAIRAKDIPEFDGDGRYLLHYTVSDFTKTLGKPEDDASNTFTARLLMLLESKCLLGPEAYEHAKEEVITSYWRDYEDHKDSFVPAFLANDIIRLWRTFCVNYEARTENQPAEKKAKRKLKNYKLKHSRLLTCYSTLLCLLDTFQKNGTISPKDALEVARITPTQRLEVLLETLDGKSRDIVAALLDKYELFLERTNEPENMMILKFLDKDMTKSLMRDANELGDLVFDAIHLIGNGSLLHRVIVV